jgi:dUTP pyrophosphatase
MVTLTYELVHANAVPPKKAFSSDTGFDLTIISIEKEINQVVTLYDTGIRAHVDDGYYLEVVPRSSIIKSGYMLANSVGIIDSHYRGNIYVALAKIDPQAKPIELPFKGFQLIVRNLVNVDLVNDHVLENTERGTGGFGSTGK